MDKRLFLGMEVAAPWPETLPEGRLIDEKLRHLTLAFLGSVEISKMEKALLDFPSPPFKVGCVGTFDQCLFFPPQHPRVAAWHIKWLEEKNGMDDFYIDLLGWLKKKGFPSPPSLRPFLPHVTLTRSPFDKRGWRREFSPLPLVAKDIHLYESLGHSKYTSLWSYPLLSPFEEIEHTADSAFLIRGGTYRQLYQHALTALSFHFPPLLAYIENPTDFRDLADVIQKLNSHVAAADQQIGCPFKAVSYHSRLETVKDLMEWEMIVDV